MSMIEYANIYTVYTVDESAGGCKWESFITSAATFAQDPAV